MKFFFTVLLLIFISIYSLFPQEILIKNKDATVWAANQNITGKLVDFYFANVSLNINGVLSNHFVEVSDSSFSIDFTIDNGLSNITVESGSIKSDTLKYTLGYKILPEIYVYATVSGRNVTLHTDVLENPKSEDLYFIWMQDFFKNPQTFNTFIQNDSTAAVTIPENSPYGEYYFNLSTIKLNEDTVYTSTYVTVDSSGIKAFDIKNDYASWIDSAVIYQITPYNFVSNGKFTHITAKLPEIKELGINTIYLQPVYNTNGRGQGYDITNYFVVRSDLGTEDQLRELVQTAKSLGMRVLFDFVANHSSIHHPYAVNSIQFGDSSHYYNFYQREEDTAPYSQHYQHYNGFINYFWDELPNLNYDNPEVHKWITEAAKYWIKKFDIDGYRFDAIWGVTARNPQFTKDLRLALKRIKPEILMLGEDKASQPQVFDERFDVAYNWASGYDWVSEWVWQFDYDPESNPTIFNSGSENSRVSMLRNSLNNNGNGYAPDAKILRFMENNDLYHFITHHSLEQTKMAAALMFSLNGVPMLYNGQETGRRGHPYEINSHYFSSNTIRSRDQLGLFPYYQRLIELRKILPALISENFSEVDVNSGSVFAYRRWFENQNVFGLINLSSSAKTVSLTFPLEEMNLDPSKNYYLTDMISGEFFSALPENLSDIDITLDAYTTRLFLLADTVMTVTSLGDFAEAEIPVEFKLEQNYPNPFNPATIINFNLPGTGNVELKVYDALGREAASLINGIKEAGVHSVIFNGADLASGIYFYRIQYDGISLTKKMLLLK